MIGPNGIPRKSPSRHGRITAVSMMKDEGPYVLEWVAHHLAVGFTDLVVFTNDCADGTDKMLMRLEKLGLAHHRANVIPRGLKPQPSALNHAEADSVVRDSDWVIVFDADEFLCIHHGDGTVGGLLDAVEAEGAQGIVITWRIFGSSGIQDWSRALVTEQYRKAAPPMWNKGWGVKTLFRYDPGKWKLGIHRPKMRNKVLDTDFPRSVRWLNGSGREMEDYFKFRGWRSIVRTVGYDWAQLNHYAVKSIDAYALRRFRGNVNDKKDKYDPAYWGLQDRNEVTDERMERYDVRRREIFDGLLCDPELQRLHYAALEKVETRLASFKGSSDYEAFVSDLKAAGSVPITQVAVKPPKPRDPGAIATRMDALAKRAAFDGQDSGGATAKRRIVPVNLYSDEAVDMSADPPLAWHKNHTVSLPADPRIFTPAAVEQISAGKFERSLARRLPGLLPQNGRFVHIGAEAGFLAAHFALSRPDGEVLAVEPDANRRLSAERIWKANHVPSARAVISGAIGPTGPASISAFFARDRVDILCLGDPALDLAWLRTALDASAHPPSTLVFTGRLWARVFGQDDKFGHHMSVFGYAKHPSFDPVIAGVYARDSAVTFA